jgi:hypothetical protein
MVAVGELPNKASRSRSRPGTEPDSSAVKINPHELNRYAVVVSDSVRSYACRWCLARGSGKLDSVIPQ